MYFKIQGTYFKIYALYFSRKTISDFQRLTKPQKFGFSTQMRAQKKSSETECTHPRKPCIVFAEPTDFTHMPLVSPKLPNAIAKTPSDAFKKTSKPYNDFLYFHLLIKTVGIFSAFPENQAK